MGKTGIIVGVVVGLIVVTAIVVPCVLLIPSSSSNSAEDLPPFAFEDIWSGKYSYRSIYPNWDKSTEEQTDYITTNNGAVVRRYINKPDEDAAVLAEKEVQDSLKATFSSISADAKFIAYRSNYQKVWRHSYTADFNVYDVEMKKEVDFKLPSTIQHLEWAPNGHGLAFVHDFTVKMVDDISDASALVVQVSPQGIKNMDYYGIPDWMYEEEMISANNVLYWSPSGTRLAYLHTNEKEVQHIEYTWYGDGQYPETIEIAYPKAGTIIGTAKLYVYDLVTNRTMSLVAPSDFIDKDHYFSRFTWKNDTACLATWINRWQTTSIAQLCILNEDGLTFDCNNNGGNKEEINGGWVGSFGPFYPMWRSDSEMHDYFTIYTRENSNGDDGYWQLAYVAENSASPRWMTNTNYDIVRLNFYDSSNGYIYFTAAYDLPRRRHILRVKYDASDITDPECLTCGLMDSYPDRCGYVSPVFNEDGSLVVVNCRGNRVPLTLLIEIDVNGVWQTLPQELELNEDLSQKISEVKWPYREYKTFTSDKYPTKPYNYEIWFPADFDENKVYPLLIEVYAGPEFQKVTDTWRRGFAQTYMVSNRDVIVASVDGRGSAYEGFKFMRETYLQLGQFEPVDQTDFAQHLSSLPYVADDKIALWGWSYGGYITSHALGYDAGNTFKCGIAVAPLADWTWYDAMYAERYMGNLTTNAIGYEKASIIKAHDLNNFKNSEYTLIHGTADDNVHFQSAAEMEKALVAADVDFDAFFYADEAHSINTGPNANQHIYHQIDVRLSYCLGRVDSPYGGPN